jgi:hypothetical protein
MERCRREIAAIEAEILAGNPDLPCLCLALSDWSAELRILQNAERRQEQTRWRDGEGMGRESQTLMEWVRSPPSTLAEVTAKPSFLLTVPDRKPRTPANCSVPVSVR